MDACLRGSIRRNDAERSQRKTNRRELVAMVEDFLRGDGCPGAVPVSVVQKIEIFFLAEKGGCVLRVAAFERDGGDSCVLERIREDLERCARRRDIAGPGEKRRVDGGAVGDEENR